MKNKLSCLITTLSILFTLTSCESKNSADASGKAEYSENDAARVMIGVAGIAGQTMYAGSNIFDFIDDSSMIQSIIKAASVKTTAVDPFTVEDICGDGYATATLEASTAIGKPESVVKVSAKIEFKNCAVASNSEMDLQCADLSSNIEPDADDPSITNIYKPFSIVLNGSVKVEAEVKNASKDGTTAFDIDAKINGDLKTNIDAAGDKSCNITADLTYSGNGSNLGSGALDLSKVGTFCGLSIINKDGTGIVSKTGKYCKMPVDL